MTRRRKVGFSEPHNIHERMQRTLLRSVRVPGIWDRITADVLTAVQTEVWRSSGNEWRDAVRAGKDPNDGSPLFPDGKGRMLAVTMSASIANRVSAHEVNVRRALSRLHKLGLIEFRMGTNHQNAYLLGSHAGDGKLVKGKNGAPDTIWYDETPWWDEKLLAPIEAAQAKIRRPNQDARRRDERLLEVARQAVEALARRSGLVWDKCKQASPDVNVAPDYTQPSHSATGKCSARSARLVNARSAQNGVTTGETDAGRSEPEAQKRKPTASEREDSLRSSSLSSPTALKIKEDQNHTHGAAAPSGSLRSPEQRVCVERPEPPQNAAPDARSPAEDGEPFSQHTAVEERFRKFTTGESTELAAIWEASTSLPCPDPDKLTGMTPEEVRHGCANWGRISGGWRKAPDVPRPGALRHLLAEIRLDLKLSQEEAARAAEQAAKDAEWEARRPMREAAEREKAEKAAAWRATRVQTFVSRWEQRFGVKLVVPPDLRAFMRGCGDDPLLLDKLDEYFSRTEMSSDLRYWKWAYEGLGRVVKLTGKQQQEEEASP